MKQYQELINTILKEGDKKSPARKNLPSTTSVFGTKLSFDLRKGFPILTTKKMFFKGIVVELLWFLKGRTDLKFLVDRGVNIWNKDAYRWDLEKYGVGVLESYYGIYSLEDYVNYIKFTYSLDDLKSSNEYKLGELGKIYGYQWRYRNGNIDQVRNVYDKIINKPAGRYKIIDAWMPEDIHDMALPPCHLLYHFNCVDVDGFNYLDLNMYQRSVDTFLGLPFNITSASLFLSIMARITGRIPRFFTWMGGDTHIYDNHIEACQEILNREPYKLPVLFINKEVNSIDDLATLDYKHFDLMEYYYHPKIKAELNTGL